MNRRINFFTMRSFYKSRCLYLKGLGIKWCSGDDGHIFLGKQGQIVHIEALNCTRFSHTDLKLERFHLYTSGSLHGWNTLNIVFDEKCNYDIKTHINQLAELHKL